MQRATWAAKLRVHAHSGILLLSLLFFFFWESGRQDEEERDRERESRSCGALGRRLWHVLRFSKLKRREMTSA